MTYAQFTVKSGTELTIYEGTEITLSSETEDTLFIEQDAAVINHGVIRLNHSHAIKESEHFPITGNGYEVITTTYEDPILNVNPGNLGFELTAPTAPGLLTVKRGHTDEYPFNTAVQRWFELETENEVEDATVTFRYDSTESNMLDPFHLTLYKNPDGGINWDNHAPDNQQPYQVITQNTSLTGLFALSTTRIQIDSTNTTTLCPGEELQVWFDVEGQFNPNNTFTLELSHESGDFAIATTPIGSLNSDENGVLNYTFEDELTPGESYQLRIQSDDIALLSDTITLIISETPEVAITSLETAYCLNEPTVELTASPGGGAFMVDNTTITELKPALYASGELEIHYVYANEHGCENSDTALVMLHEIPEASLAFEEAYYCLNHGTIAPEMIPEGGELWGEGVSNLTIDSEGAGEGNHEIYYAYTDQNGCSDTALSLLEILPLPEVAFDGLADSYCLHDDFTTLTGQPEDGAFWGSGIQYLDQFHPDEAGSGVHTVSYSFTDVMGCTNIAEQQTIVYANPPQPEILADGSYLASSHTGNLQWYLGGEPIPGATGQFYQATETGFYSVALTNSNGCSTMSALESVNLTGTAEHDNTQLQVYPNPVQDVLTIAHTQFQTEVIIRLFSSDGKLVMEHHTAPDNTIQLDVQSLSKGIYMMQVLHEEQPYHQKIVKL